MTSSSIHQYATLLLPNPNQGVHRIPPMQSVTLEFADFDLLRRMIRERSGVWLGDDQKTFLQVRLGERMRARSVATPRDYYYLLKFDAGGSEELQSLLEVVTTKETWFFRETRPVEAWRDGVLPAIVERARRIRLWSAACSSGEEPYSVAILLLEAAYKLGAFEFDVIASDLSHHAIATAQA